MFKQPIACVINNGWWSDWYYPSRGTRQGCTYSPSIFILAVELLGLGLRQNKGIQGIMINGEEIKSGQFADDLWTSILATDDNVRNTLVEIDQFSDFSGLKLNMDKTAAIRIGSLRNSDAKFYTERQLFWSPNAIKILGIYVTPNPVESYERNFSDLLPTVEHICQTWMSRNLSWMGKITIVNTLINPLFYHKLIALPAPPPSFFKLFQKVITNFIWNHKPPRISYVKLVHNYSKFGLKLADLSTKMHALKAAWPVRWMNRNQKEIQWFFNSLPIKNNRIWTCNLSYQDAKRIRTEPHLSSAYSILSSWALLNFKSSPLDFDSILGMVLYGNSLIRRAGSPIFDDNLINSNIDTILDIYHPTEKRFLTMPEIIDLFGPELPLLTYYGIIASIPRVWKVELRNNVLDFVLDLGYNVEEIAARPSFTKWIYWSLIDKLFPLHVDTRRIWQKELNIDIPPNQWEACLDLLFQSVKPVKLRLFQYRLLTKTLTTNVLRHKWDPLNISPYCFYCNKTKETYLHLFLECEFVQLLWRTLEKWCSYFLGDHIEFTPELVICNQYYGKNKDVVNMCIIVMKQYIYASKCLQEPLSFYNYISKLTYWYRIELGIAYKNHTTKKFYKKWQNVL